MGSIHQHIVIGATPTVYTAGDALTLDEAFVAFVALGRPPRQPARRMTDIVVYAHLHATHADAAWMLGHRRHSVVAARLHHSSFIFAIVANG